MLREKLSTALPYQHSKITQNRKKTHLRDALLKDSLLTKSAQDSLTIVRWSFLQVSGSAKPTTGFKKIGDSFTEDQYEVGLLRPFIFIRHIIKNDFGMLTA